MKIIVGSIKYSPTYKSNCCAFGKECEKLGHSVTYLFSHSYKKMLSKEIQKKSIFVGNSVNILSCLFDTLSIKIMRQLKELLLEDSPHYVYLYNYHPLNNYISKILKKTNCKLIYHVHEPYTINKKAHGGIQQYWLYLFEFLQDRLLKNTDIAVLPSREASVLFEKRYSSYEGQKRLIPLLYEDLEEEIVTDSRREYITFIGPPVPAKGPEIFLKVIDATNQNGQNLKYLLISREKIEDKIYNKKNLEIYHKVNISDQEFGSLLKKSLLTITPYTRATQSSVVLVSYMYGTPVLSSNVGGLKEFVHHKKTGYLVDLNSNEKDWIKGIDYIVNNNEKLSKNCRKYFLSNFSETNWPKYFKDLFRKRNEQN